MNWENIQNKFSSVKGLELPENLKTALKQEVSQIFIGTTMALASWYSCKAYFTADEYIMVPLFTVLFAISATCFEDLRTRNFDSVEDTYRFLADILITCGVGGSISYMDPAQSDFLPSMFKDPNGKAFTNSFLSVLEVVAIGRAVFALVVYSLVLGKRFEPKSSS